MTSKGENVERGEITALVEGLTSALAGVTDAPAATSSRLSPPSTASTQQGVAESLSGSLASSTAAMTSIAKSMESGVQRLAGPLGFLATLNPIVAGLSKLFGGGEKHELPALPRYERPEALRINAGVTEGDGWRVHGVDYGANGLPRSMDSTQPAPQIVVQVQALDSRSFLDRRDDIASAVKQALLESHSLSDVMGDR